MDAPWWNGAPGDARGEHMEPYGRLLDDEPRASDPVTCDECGVPVIYLVSVSWQGQYCSRHCANLATERHALAMEKRHA